MELTYAGLSIAGARDHNEDQAAFWQADSRDARRAVGQAAILADGVGGENRGEVASMLAVDTALEAFRTAAADTSRSKLLRAVFERANLAVYDAANHGKEKGAMSTTLTISLFRHDAVVVAHVGDTRVYHVRGSAVKRLTTDHSYVALQIKLGLIHERDAMASGMRSILTRTIGHEAICRLDLNEQSLMPGDCVVQCTDGLYAYVVDEEILEIAGHYPPEEACRRLVALAESRRTDDNVSVQVIRVDAVEHVGYVRGVPIYQSDVSRPVDVPAGQDIEAGQVLDDRYEIVDAVSRSGMASIFKAVDRQTGGTVALKVPLLRFEADPASFSRFEREEEIGKSLDHPYILKFLPGPEERSRPYIVMEFLEGQTLADVLHTIRPLPEPDAVKIASRIAEALDYLHQKTVVHRDLKPQNIMICEDGSIRIMDFGIAKAARSRRITFVGFSPTMGTPDYMAPEQVRGRRGDERTDIYALGAILYELLTGSVLFEGESPYVTMNARLTGDPTAPRKVNPKLTPVVEEIVLHALERDPARRYQTAAEMKAELDDYERVQITGRHHHLELPQPWKSKWKWLPVILGFIVLQIIMFYVFYLTTHRHGH